MPHRFPQKTHSWRILKVKLLASAKGRLQTLECKLAETILISTMGKTIAKTFGVCSPRRQTEKATRILVLESSIKNLLQHINIKGVGKVQ